MSHLVSQYITRPLTDSEIEELADEELPDAKFVIQELKEIQKLLKDKKHPNKERLLIQFNNLYRVHKYLRRRNVIPAVQKKAQLQAFRDVYDKLTKSSSEPGKGPADLISKFAGINAPKGSARKTRRRRR